MLEIILGLVGIWILISGKVPAWIIGKKDYEILGIKARLIGLILSLPFPISLVSGIILGILVGRDAVNYAVFLEAVVFTTDLIVVLVLIRKFRTLISSAISQQ